MPKTPRFAVIGLGRFGSRLAVALTEAGAEVIAIDRNPKLVESLRDEVTLAVRLDSTVEEGLRAQGIDKVDAAIVAIGEDFESTVLTTTILREMGVEKVFARGETDTEARILAKVGAGSIINPEQEAAARWAHRLMLPNLRQYVELGEGHSMIHMVAPSAFHHKSLSDLKLRVKYGVNVVAINRSAGPEEAEEAESEGEPQPKPPAEVVYVPKPETRIMPDDVLVLVGSNENLSELPKA